MAKKFLTLRGEFTYLPFGKCLPSLYIDGFATFFSLCFLSKIQDMHKQQCFFFSFRLRFEISTTSDLDAARALVQ